MVRPPFGQDLHHLTEEGAPFGRREEPPLDDDDAIDQLAARLRRELGVSPKDFLLCLEYEIAISGAVDSIQLDSVAREILSARPGTDWRKMMAKTHEKLRLARNPERALDKIGPNSLGQILYKKAISPIYIEKNRVNTYYYFLESVAGILIDQIPFRINIDGLSQEERLQRLAAIRHVPDDSKFIEFARLLLPELQQQTATPESGLEAYTPAAGTSDEKWTERVKREGLAPQAPDEDVAHYVSRVFADRLDTLTGPELKEIDPKLFGRLATHNSRHPDKALVLKPSKRGPKTTRAADFAADVQDNPALAEELRKARNLIRRYERGLSAGK